MAVGDDQRGSLGHLVGQQRVDVGGRKQRAVAGDEQRALDAIVDERLDPACGGGVVAPLVVLDHARAVPTGDSLRDAIAAHDDDPLERRHPPERDERVGEHRLGQRPAVVLGQLEAQALLGLVEALDREDRDGPHVTAKAS